MKKTLLTFLLITTLSINCYSQDDGLPPDADEPDVPAAPINENITVLLILGAVYSCWRMNNKRENKA